MVVGCTQTFRICGSDGLPLPLCLDYCEALPKECGFNCSVEDPILKGVPLWQTETNRSGTPQVCAQAREEEVNCPLPFLSNPNADQCTFKCPPTGLDDETINDRTITLAIVGGSLSVASSVLLLPYLYWASAGVRKNFMVEMWLAIFISATGDLVPKWKSAKDIMCSDDYTLRTRSSSSCLYTSFTGFWGRQAVTYWGMINMYRLTETIYRLHWMRKLTHDKITWWLDDTLVCNLIGWGLPSLQFIIALARGWINASSGPYSCAVDASLYGGWVNNGLALLPLTFVVSATTLFIFAIFYKMAMLGRAVVRQYWNMLVVCSIYAAVVWYIIIFAWHTFSIRDRVTERIVDYIGCAVGTGGSPSCEYHGVINTGWQLSVVFMTSFYPVFLFIPFMLSGPLQFYGKIITTMKLPEPPSPTPTDMKTSMSAQMSSH